MNESILIVDDDLETRDALCHWAELAGYAAHGAVSAEDALEMLAETTVDLAIVDLMLPGMDGLSLAQRLLDKDPDLPVLLITGFGDLDSARRAIEVGIYQFFTKPYSFGELEVGVRRALEHRRLSLENKAYQEGLERQVVERTAELDAANAQLKKDIAERKQAEDALERRDDILASISYSVQEMLMATEWDRSIGDVLGRLGAAAGVSRTYVFQNHLGEDGELLTSQRHEWVAPGIASQMDNPDCQNFPWRGGGIDRWQGILSEGGTVSGHVRDFPASEQEILGSQNILSVIAVPILVSGGWWGFVGFDECKHEREWSSAEVDAIRTAGDILGAIIERRHLEEELRDGEEKLKALINATADIAFLADSDGVFLEVNKALARSLGCKKEDLLGKSLLQSLPEKAVARSRSSHYQDLIAAKEPRQWEDERAGKHFDNTAYPVLDASGNVKYIALFARDITEKKRTEEALRESEEYLSRAQEIAHLGHWRLDPETKEVTGSDELFRIFGISRDEATLDAFVGVVHPEDREFDLRHITKGITHGESWDIEHRLICKDGTEKTVHAIGEAVTDDSGKTVGLVGTVQDVTERSRTEERVRFLSSVAEQINDAILVTDTNFAVTYTNNAFEQLFGYALDDLRGKTPDILNAEPLADQIQQELYGVVSAGKEYLGESLNRRKDGSTFVCEYKVMPLIDKNGGVYAYVCVQRDITDRRRMEVEIRRAHNLESLGTLAGGIAHDFNNVLTGVTGNLALLGRMLDKDSEEYEIVQEARQSADRTRDLTRQLMAFAKGGAPVKETVSIEALVRETADLSLSGSNTKPYYMFPEGLSPADIDRGQIGQVLQNIVLNADQAMPDGGAVKISAENIEIPERDPLPLEAGRYVDISVEDQGIGMSEDVLARIFDPYYTTKAAGHGLGLAIAHTIISNHGGIITVTSEVGVGTTFEIFLPASEKQPVEMVERETEPARGSGRILLMDDEDAILRTAGRMLEELGYTVTPAKDGDEALQAYEAALAAGNPYELVIMDLTIPGGMGGKAAVKKLHEIDPDARVIVSSGYSNDPVMANPDDFGFMGIVKKPIDLDELAEVVRRATA